MNERIWAATLITTLIGSLWGGAVYGERTTKPLWLVFVVVAIAVEIIIALVFAISDPWPPKSSDLMFYLAAFLPVSFFFGLFSYGSARRARGVK